MDKNNSFNKFVSSLKKYPTNEVAKLFSKYERDCYKDSEKGILTEKEFDYKFYKQKIYIKPWLFPEIIYYSTSNNDHRNGTIVEDDAWDIYGLYQNYDMDKEDNHIEKSNTDENMVFTYILYGIAQQQFIYQKSHRYINRFSRNYHLLKDIEIDGESLSTIVKEKFSISLKKYVEMLTLITILSMKNVVINTEQILSIVKDKDLYLDIIDYLSVDYYECRNTKLKQDVFKVKPILHSQMDEYIVPSFCLMMYNLGDNLYWLLKDKFSKGNKFVVKFGEIFENYVYEVLLKHFSEKVVRIPRVEGKKSADFYIESDKFVYLIEVKSGVAKLDSKTAVLNQKSLDDFIKNNVTDAILQIDASAQKFKNKRIVPIVVNFDVLFTEDSLLHNVENLCCVKNFNIKETILLGIDDFENFLYTYKNLEKIDKLIEDVLKDKNLLGGVKIYKLLENVRGHKNYYFKDVFNINKNILNQKTD